MPSGSCLCGKTTMEVTGEPQMTALCHCEDCQKISGSTYSTNMIIKEDEFNWTGSKPKQFTKKANSGKTIVSHFCADCGSTLARTGEAFPGAVIVKAGTLQGGIEKAKPGAELFSPGRASWLGGVSGAQQVEGMPPA